MFHCYFNSTEVRLWFSSADNFRNAINISILQKYDYDAQNKHRKELFAHFNSTEVRLWSELFLQRGIAYLLFQFYRSTIMILRRFAFSRIDSIFQFYRSTIMIRRQRGYAESSANFNSTEVRLWFWPRQTALIWLTFQFYRSTIMIQAGGADEGLQHDFNSTEVRLWWEVLTSTRCGKPISILQKYDYDCLTHWAAMPLLHFNSTEVRLWFISWPIIHTPKRFQFYRSTIMILSKNGKELSQFVCKVNKNFSKKCRWLIIIFCPFIDNPSKRLCISKSKSVYGKGRYLYG